MTDWPKKGDTLVRGKDYDALLARLAEAERLLTTVAGGTYWLKDNPQFFVDLRTFLRTADSAEGVKS